MKLIISTSTTNVKRKPGLYSHVSVDPLSLPVLLDIAQTLDIQLPPKLHCTVMYSNVTPRSLAQATKVLRKDFRALLDEVTWWEGHDKKGYLVLKLISEDLKEEHARLKQAGCCPSYDKYVPHITLKTPCRESVGFGIKLANLKIRRQGPSIILTNQKIQPYLK